VTPVFERLDALPPLSEEERQLLDSVKALAHEEIMPRAAEYDRSGEFPWDNIRAINALGLNAMFVPEAYGGAGLSYAAYLACVREISQACASTGITLAAHVSLGTSPIYNFGTAEQKRKYLPALCSGEKLAAFGLTEPEAGSDAGGTKTRAVGDGDHYLVNGRKIYITNGSVCGTAVFTAVTTPGIGVKGISAFIIEKGTPGFSAGTREKKLGHRASDTVELLFENVKLPKENLLERDGKEGQGFTQFMKTLDGGRISIGAMSIGIAQASLDAALRYSRQRRQFGKAIAEFQAIQLLLADMVTQIEAARLLVESRMNELAREADRRVLSDFPRFAELGVIANFQLLWAQRDDYVGKADSATAHQITHRSGGFL